MTLHSDTIIKETDEHWNILITPKNKWFDLKLKEVWHYRDLLWLWVRREYVGTYKQTILGPMWHFISPIFGTIIYMFIFGRIAKLSTGGVPMFLFYNAGLAIWNFFSGCFGSSSSAFSRNAGIFGKVYFPRLIMPLASIVNTLIKFGIQFCLFLVIYFYVIIRQGYHPQVGWGLFYIPLALLLTAGIGFGSGLVVSSITTKYRDLNMLIGFVIQLLMYTTPVVYSLGTLSPELQHWLSFNPLVAPVEAFKFAVFGKGQFSFGSLTYSFAWMIVFMLAGMVIFNKAEKNFMDTV